MTKTGFVNAHINKTNIKYYKYHGITKPCNIQPDPDPGYVYPQVPPGPGWELLWDHDFWSPAIYKKVYSILDFFPSSDFDNCPNHFADYKKRYYFCEMSYVKVYAAAPLFIAFANGAICENTVILERGSFMYKAWFAHLYALENYVFQAAYPVAGSHLKIWRSETGELPGYYPIPEDYYFY